MFRQFYLIHGRDLTRYWHYGSGWTLELWHWMCTLYFSILRSSGTIASKSDSLVSYSGHYMVESRDSVGIFCNSSRLGYGLWWNVFQRYCRNINQLHDFNGISNSLWLFLSKGQRIVRTVCLYLHFSCVFWYTVIWFEVFFSNKNNFHSIVLFHVLRFNTNKYMDSINIIFFIIFICLFKVM